MLLTDELMKDLLVFNFVISLIILQLIVRIDGQINTNIEYSAVNKKEEEKNSDGNSVRFLVLNIFETDNYKVCRGTEGEDVTKYETFIQRYSNCTYVDGNLELLFVTNRSLNFSFLSEIREITGYVRIFATYLDYIPLDNLRVIRGRRLFVENGVGYSLYVAYNFDPDDPQNIGLKELRLNSLHEIQSGNVYIQYNNRLCHSADVQWSDIVTGVNRQIHVNQSFDVKFARRPCSECHPECEMDGKRYCWGDGSQYCQKLNRALCSSQCDGQCFGSLPNQCCDVECIGGCMGPLKNQCWACKHFDNNGTCLSYCPPQFIYSHSQFRQIPNPAFKYSYGTLCVDKCPEHLISRQGTCVQECGPGMMPDEDRKCVDCNGPCPKPCTLTDSNLHSANVKSLEGCTDLVGSIVILDLTFDGDSYSKIQPMRVDSLKYLKDIKEISGFIKIQANKARFKNLSFLSRLHTIHGQTLDRNGAAVNIFGSSLESLGLNSLKRINNGGILVSNNTDLCFADKINWTKFITTAKQKIIIRNNKKEQDCASQLHVCDPECFTDGCWATGNHQCLSCRNYYHNYTGVRGDNVRKCVTSCSSQPGMYLIGDKQCGSCHEQCKSNCTGPGADECDNCKSVKDGPFCQATCPPSKYADGLALCQDCSELCSFEGCTGPEAYQRIGGCKTCSLPIYDWQEPLFSSSSSSSLSSSSSSLPPSSSFSSSSVAKCMPVDSDCPAGFYKRHINTACLRCHPLCHTCIGPFLDDCLTCIYLNQDGRCVQSCEPDYYETVEYFEIFNGTTSVGTSITPVATPTCKKCHDSCLKCIGPSNKNCTICKQYKVHIDDDDDDDGDDADGDSDGDYSEVDSNKNNIDGEDDDGDGGGGDNDSGDGGGDNDGDKGDGGGGGGGGGVIGGEKKSRRKMKKSYEFYCTEKCPDNKPETRVNNTETICYPIDYAAKRQRDMYITLGVLTSLLVIFTIVCSLLIKRKKSADKFREFKTEMQKLNATPLETPAKAEPDLSSLLVIKKSELTIGTAIGCGAYGTVCKGAWTPSNPPKPRIEVAIKILKEGTQELLDEARIMASVKHECCINILCVCLTKKLMLITPLMTNGCMLDFIRKNTDKISAEVIMRWSTQVAEGMNYLEQLSIVHCDLAARNVLVENLDQVKITDFGLAKLIGPDDRKFEGDTNATFKLPIKWLAFECLVYKIFDHKSDVWSYGVTIWELCTFGDRPYKDVSDHKNIPAMLEIGYRLEKPLVCSDYFYEILKSCWYLNPHDRPTFKDLVEKFEVMQQNPNCYLRVPVGIQPTPSHHHHHNHNTMSNQPNHKNVPIFRQSGNRQANDSIDETRHSLLSDKLTDYLIPGNKTETPILYNNLMRVNQQQHQNMGNGDLNQQQQQIRYVNTTKPYIPSEIPEPTYIPTLKPNNEYYNDFSPGFLNRPIRLASNSQHYKTPNSTTSTAQQNSDDGSLSQLNGHLPISPHNGSVFSNGSIVKPSHHSLSSNNKQQRLSSPSFKLPSLSSPHHLTTSLSSSQPITSPGLQFSAAPPLPLSTNQLRDSLYGSDAGKDNPDHGYYNTLSF